MNWKSIARKYDGQDVLIAVHLGYGNGRLDCESLNHEISVIGQLGFPIIEVVAEKRHLDKVVITRGFPHEDELKGYRLGRVYLCGAKREKCIPRMEAALNKFCDTVVRLENLIH